MYGTSFQNYFCGNVI